MAIRATCEGCGKLTQTGDDWAERTGLCPHCGRQVSFPTAKPVVHAPVAKPVNQPAADTRVCPFCGEVILSVAKKCKHCGEYLDILLRQSQPKSTSLLVMLCVSGVVAPIVAILIFTAIANQAGSHRHSPEQRSQRSSLAGLWTKTSKPGWVHRLDPKVQTAFSNMMNDKSPLYTGFYCDEKSTKVYVNRVEWRQLNRFQAGNQLGIFSTLLPHTNNTVIELIDDNTQETLVQFTPDQKMDSIDIVHP